jgi:hypothetical protein
MSDIGVLALFVGIAVSWYLVIESVVITRAAEAERAFRAALENLAAPNDTVTARVCDRDGQVIRHIYWSRKQAAEETSSVWQNLRFRGDARDRGEW